MKSDQRIMGKGLSALLGEMTEADSARKPIGYVNKELAGANPGQKSSDIVMVRVDQLETNPYQPRLEFDEKSIQELAQSIKALGLIQPIVARRTAEGRYQIISGERRWRACQTLGMELIPAYVRDATNESMLEMAIVENLQREDLDPIEIAMSFRSLMDECNLTQEQMAFRVGKKRASVTNYLRLLKLPAKVQHDLKVGLLSVGHAKVILGVEDKELQEKLCDLAVKNALSVRQLEDKVRSLTEAKPATSPVRIQELPDEYCRVLEHIGKYFEQDISLKRTSGGKGTMTIKFNSDDEVRSFLKALEDAQI